MRKKLMLLAALNCVLGAWLLAPASAQRRYPPCEALQNSDCPEVSAIQPCVDEQGNLGRLVCSESDTGDFTWRASVSWL